MAALAKPRPVQSFLEEGPILCPLRHMTGLKCPACGGTRALASLLRCDLVTAFRMNAFLVTAVLVGITYLTGKFTLAGRYSGDPSATRESSTRARWIWLSSFLAWGILRNLQV